MMNNCYWKDRIKIYLLDFFSFYLTYMVTIISVTIILLIISDVFYVNIEDEAILRMARILYVITEKPYALTKDFLFKSGSLGKKMMKCKVVDPKTGEKPKAIKLVLRNLLEMDPLFVIGIIISYKRRDSRTLADIITKTDVVYLPEEKTGDGSLS